MPDSSANDKRIVKNTVLLNVRMVIVLVISLYISRITLHNLGVEDFGIYNVVCGFVALFSFLSAAMASGIQRFFNYEYGKNGIKGANKVFMTSLQSQALLAIIIVIVLESIGLWYIHHKMVIPTDRLFAAKWIYQMAIFSMVITIFQAPFDAAIMAHERMGFYAFLSILNQLLKLIIVLLLPILPGDSLITYGFCFLIITCLDFLLSLGYTRGQFEEIRLSSTYDKGLFKEMFIFSGWNILGKFALTMKEQGLNMILNLFFGPVLNAARGLAFQVTSALNGFVSNISLAVRPQLTQSYAQGNQRRMFGLMFSNTKIGFIVLFFLALPVCLEIDFLLKLWLGVEVPNYTDSFIIIVFLITLFNGLQGNISFVVHANGNLKVYSIINSLITLMVVPFGYYVLKMGHNPNSVFWVSLVITIINYGVSIYILQKLVHFSLAEYFYKVVAPLFAMAIVSLPLPLLIKLTLADGWFRFAIVTIISAICTFLSSFFIVLDKKERGFVNNLLISKVKVVRQFLKE